jgi:hypothetical protein
LEGLPTSAPDDPLPRESAGGKTLLIRSSSKVFPVRLNAATGYREMAKTVLVAPAAIGKSTVFSTPSVNASVAMVPAEPLTV